MVLWGYKAVGYSIKTGLWVEEKLNRNKLVSATLAVCCGAFELKATVVPTPVKKSPHLLPEFVTDFCHDVYMMPVVFFLSPLGCEWWHCEKVLSPAPGELILLVLGFFLSRLVGVKWANECTAL